MISPATVIIPTLNEAAHIGALLDHLLAEPASITGEIIVADGGSTDATRAITLAIAERDKRVRLIDNPGRTQAIGMNKAVAASNPRFPAIVRVDAHSRYPKNYVGAILSAMEASRADSVTVRLRSEGTGRLQQAIAVISNSAIGTGGSAHRVGGVSGFVDHGHHAGFRRAIYIAAGGYDPSFKANEDAELDYRIRKLGGRIWLAGDIEVGYFPRSTLSRLAVQYWRYGSGRAGNYLKHRERLRARQMLPPLMVSAAAIGAAITPIWPLASIIPAGYAAGVAAGTLWLTLKSRSLNVVLAAPALVIMHFSWGMGFLSRLIAGKFQEGRRSASA